MLFCLLSAVSGVPFAIKPADIAINTSYGYAEQTVSACSTTTVNDATLVLPPCPTQVYEGTPGALKDDLGMLPLD
jgi:hypothetical protein